MHKKAGRKGERFGTRECERSRGNREVTVGIAPSPQQSEGELELHIQEKHSTKVYDLNQKTMQALDIPAEEYEIFEETMKKVTHETEEGDMLFAAAYETMEEVDKAQKDQDRLQDELEATCESMVIASREFTNCWALHEVASANLNGTFREVSNCRALHEVTCVDLKKACQRTVELKRTADNANERTMSHRKRCRRATTHEVRTPPTL